MNVKFKKITAFIFLIIFITTLFTVVASAEETDEAARAEPLRIALTGVAASQNINLKMVNTVTGEEISLSFLIYNDYMTECDLPSGTYKITQITTNRKNYELSASPSTIQVDADAEYITIKITEKDLSKTFGYFFKNNAFLLIGLFGCCIAYVIIKKKQENELREKSEKSRKNGGC